VKLRDSRGFSLIELAIYIALLGMIAALLTPLIISMFNGQKTVSTLTTAASESQNATTVLHADIRNARELRVGGTNGSWLSASIAQGTNGWQCVRWRFDAAGHTLSRTTWPEGTAFPAGARGVIANNVTTQGSTNPFSLAAGTGTATATGTVTYSLRVGGIDMSGKASNRAAAAGSATCFA